MTWDRRLRQAPTVSKKEMEDLAYLRGLREGKGKGKSGADAGKGGKGADKGGGGKGKAKGETTDTPKGGGKGKEQAKGKGKSNTAWWQCPAAPCRKHNGGKAVWNHPDRESCYVCFCPHTAAAANRESELAELREAVAKETADKEKKKAAEDKKAAEKKAADKKKSEEQKAAKEKEKKAADKKTPAEQDPPKDEEMDAAADEEESLAVLTKEFLETEKILRMPKALKDSWSATAVIEEYLETTPENNKGELEAELEDLKTVLTLEGSKVMKGHDFAADRKKIEQLERKVSKAADAVPGAAVSLAELRWAREKYLEDEQKRAAAAELGVERAARKVVELQDIVQNHIEAWEKVKKKIKEEEEARTLAWTERKNALNQRQSQVLALIDSKITASQASGAADQAVQEAKDQVEAAADAADEASRKAYAQLQHAATFEEKDLPDIQGMKLANDVMKNTATTMYHWARASYLGDQYLPFTWAQMGATPEMSFDLVGAKIWAAFFGESKVLPTDVCPMILRQLVFRQLMQFAEVCKAAAKSKDLEAAAKKLLGDASAELLGKRRQMRGSPYGNA